MKELFEIASKRHAEIVKHAFLGTALRGGAKLLGSVVKRPGMMLNTAFSAPDVIGSVKRSVSAVANKPGILPMGPT